MKSLFRPILMLLACWIVFVLAAPAQGPSLADLARQTRAKKEQQPKSGKVFTNDSIPAATISAAPEAEAAAEKPEGEAAAEAAEAEEPSYEELEKEYRAKFAELKQNLDTEERRLDVLQRELNLAQQQFYSDPNVALREQYSREDINKRTAEIEAQKAKVEEAKKAIADLEDELRHKGLPPGWAR